MPLNPTQPAAPTTPTRPKPPITTAIPEPNKPRHQSQTPPGLHPILNISRAQLLLGPSTLTNCKAEVDEMEKYYSALHTPVNETGDHRIARMIEEGWRCERKRAALRAEEVGVEGRGEGSRDHRKGGESRAIRKVSREMRIEKIADSGLDTSARGTENVNVAASEALAGLVGELEELSVEVHNSANESTRAIAILEDAMATARGLQHGFFTRCGLGALKSESLASQKEDFIGKPSKPLDTRSARKDGQQARLRGDDEKTADVTGKGYGPSITMLDSTSKPSSPPDWSSQDTDSDRTVKQSHYMPSSSLSILGSNEGPGNSDADSESDWEPDNVVVPALAKAFEDAEILAPRLPRWKRWEEVAEKRIVRLFVDIVFDWVVLLVVGTMSYGLRWFGRGSTKQDDGA